MNRVLRRARINRVNERRQRREESSEIESESADKYDPRIAKISVFVSGILFGRIFAEWFTTIEAVSSLNIFLLTLTNFIAVFFVGLMVFWLSTKLIKQWWPNNYRLDEAAFFGSMISVALGFLSKFVL